LLRPGSGWTGGLIGRRCAEGFGERSPRVVGVVVRHDAGSLRGGSGRRRQAAVRRRP
jgi:hypothetical protein